MTCIQAIKLLNLCVSFHALLACSLWPVARLVMSGAEPQGMPGGPWHTLRPTQFAAPAHVYTRERNKKLSRPSLIVASSGQFHARLRSHRPVVPPAACWLAAQDCCHLLLWCMLIHFFMICLPAPRSLVTTTLHKGWYWSIFPCHYVRFIFGHLLLT